MPTTYTNGLKLPDLGSIDWFNAYKNNIDILDPIVGTVNGVATTYAPISHNHDASEITSGTIDIARLPPAALERLTTVADQTARYALTTSTVQLGDTVKQLDTGIMYLVVDTTKLNSADGYVEYSAGTASKAIADEDGTNIKTGYVNRTTNQSIAGQKTFFDNIFFTSPMYPKNTSYEIGNTPASNVAIPIYFTDKNNVYTGYVRSTIYTSGRTATEIRAKNTFKSGVLDPTGADISSNLNVEVQPNGAKTIYWDGLIRNDVTPFTTNNNSLGTSTNQWSSVYAQSYYYNGTAWGLDKANVWTGANTFSAGVLTTMVETSQGNTGLIIRSTDQTWESGARIFLYSNTQTGQTNGSIYVDVDHGDNGNTKTGLTLIPNAFYPMGGTVNTTYGVSLGTATYQWAKVYSEQYYYNGTQWGLDKSNLWTGNNTFKSANTNLAIQSTVSELGSLTAASNWFRWIDKNGAQNAYISRDVWSDGADSLRIAIVGKRTSGAPSTSGTEIDCGVRLNLEADGTKSFAPFDNNISLGTPTNKWKTLNGINPGALSLPGTGGYTDIKGDITNLSGGNNTFTAPYDGWVCIKSTNATAIHIINTTWAVCQSATQSTAGTLCCLCPVMSGQSFNVIVNATSLEYAYIHPCKGNV